ncbi:hypothetical protein MPSEU_000753900 [Mayamaea pseudoterrestris]|nr:hypothetical protein MPSEU_000753900 [Mayamaea pseudoterrestris]
MLQQPSSASQHSSRQQPPTSGKSCAATTSPWFRSRRAVMPALEIKSKRMQQPQPSSSQLALATGIIHPASSRASVFDAMLLQVPEAAPAAMSIDIITSTFAAAANDASSITPPSLVHWLQSACPRDLLPKILALAGPQTTRSLYETNAHWKKLIEEEATWKILCMDSYKWKEGDAEPESWKDFYRFSPCVPVDYSSISSALALAHANSMPSHFSMRSFLQRNAGDSSPRNLQARSIRVLLRPNTKYMLKESIVVCAPHGVMVSIETIQLPRNLFQPPMNSSMACARRGLDTTAAAFTSSLPAPSSKKRIRWNCKFAARDQVEVLASFPPPIESHDSDVSFSSLSDSTSLSGRTVVPQCASSSSSSLESDTDESATPREQTAIVCLKTRRENEPVFLVQQGVLNLDHLTILHSSHGLDIWNGNAAIQLQPMAQRNIVLATPPPSLPVCRMTKCLVTSKSGRGIVCMDGGSLDVQSCAVIKCAATGVYVGGNGSRANMQQSDVVLNGIGSKLIGGIARGHSGVYLEQGDATVVDSSISNNTLTGISSVSPGNAILRLRGSELINNGSDQLELPPSGTVSYRRSEITNNLQADDGTVKQRSGLLDAKVLRKLGEGRMTTQHWNVGGGGPANIARRRLPAPAAGGVEQL